MIRLIRQYHKTLSSVSPKIAANSAFELFRKVRKKKIKDQEKPFYKEASQKNIEVENETIHSFEFGNPENDIVILLHGWDSNAGCMYKFVEPLLQMNKHIISFNLPGHAFHKSSKTNIYEAKETFKKFMNTLPKGRNISIISHSFGSGVVGYGLSELDVKIDTLVFMTTPDNMADIFLDYKNLIGLNEKAYQHLCDRASKIVGEDLLKLSIASKLKNANFEHLHLFHNPKDKILPYKNSTQIADQIENSTLHTLHKMGHYKMLWNDELVNMVMAVMK